MNYFNYQKKGQMGVVWNLFADLSNVPGVDREPDNFLKCNYGHSLEIINCATNPNYMGSLINEESFDLRSYELKCQENDAIGIHKQVEHLLHIVDKGGDVEEVGFGEIDERRLPVRESEFDEVDSKESLNGNLEELKSIRQKYIKNTGKDVLVMLKGSLEGIPSAMDEVRILSDEDLKFKELILDLCENDVDNLLLERLDAES